MRKITYAMSVSLDGLVASANGDIDWSYPDEELHQHLNDRERTMDVFLYGRRMYEDMAAYWPGADARPDAPQVEIEYARIWKSKPKVVFSKNLQQVAWNSTLVREDIAGVVKKLKEQPGDAMSVGGVQLASALMQLGLVDEYWLYVHPVILGSGKPMFAGLRDRIDVELVETHTFRAGVVLLRYRRVDNGKNELGSEIL